MYPGLAYAGRAKAVLETRGHSGYNKGYTRTETSYKREAMKGSGRQPNASRLVKNGVSEQEEQPVAFCQVIVDIAHEDVDRVFTYRVPEGMRLCPGMRVHVPFGRMKHIEGVVVSMEATCDLPEERVRDVTDTLEDYPAILPNLLHLAGRIHEHAFCTLAQALRLMLPAQRNWALPRAPLAPQ